MEENISEILTAISHPNRIRILKTLKDTTLCGCELQPILKLEQSNLSRHLSVLVKAGILFSWKDGVRMNYKVVDQKVFDIINIAEKLLIQKQKLVS